MGHRLSKIYTRTGDEGTTRLANHDKVPKNAPRIAITGEIDELNSLLGLIISYEAIPANIKKPLLDIQHQLFDIGGELSLPDYQAVQQSWVNNLETYLDQLNADLPALKEFILPGGHPAAAQCHLARAVCRRAERYLVTLHQQEPVRAEVLRYINRLSDVLFVVARYLNYQLKHEETLWKHKKKE